MAASPLNAAFAELVLAEGPVDFRVHTFEEPGYTPSRFSHAEEGLHGARVAPIRRG